MYFKDKTSGGWPGNTKLMFDDNTYRYVDISERQKIKSYFIPERCLYCSDKLNRNADLSVGDNYTNKHSSKKGSNSIIIRTNIGESSFSESKPYLHVRNIKYDEIAKSQRIDLKYKNYIYYKLKKGEQSTVKHHNGYEYIESDELQVYISEYEKRSKDLYLGSDGFIDAETLRSRVGFINKPK
jgi:coenzyme F420-reducing hydrogenase beta subunit